MDWQPVLVWVDVGYVGDRLRTHQTAAAYLCIQYKICLTEAVIYPDYDVSSLARMFTVIAAIIMLSKYQACDSGKMQAGRTRVVGCWTEGG